MAESVMKSPSRREFLKTAAIGAGGLVVACGGDDVPALADGAPAADGSPSIDGGVAPADAAPPPDAEPEPVVPPEQTPESGSFALGVSSGDATSERVILWTRYDGAAPLRLVVWEMLVDLYARVAFEADGIVVADGGFVHIDATGLGAGKHYRFAFFEMDGEARIGRSLIGRFRAAIAADAMERVVLGAYSCAKNGHTFNTLGHAGQRSGVDQFLLLGDTVYADDVDSVAEYRGRWAENLSTSHYRSFLASTSVVATWDDHEVENNWDPVSADPTRLASGRQTFFENTPIRRDADDDGRIYRRFKWGRTAELFCLDCRGERKPDSRNGPDAEYISVAQMEWLKAGLAASDSVFKVIMNSVPIANYPSLFDAAIADRWEGYPAQREEILAFIDDTPITGVLWVAGDFHLGAMGRVDSEGLGATQVEIVASPAAQTANPLSFLLTAPQFDWAASQNNYVILDFNPWLGEVQVTFYDDGNDILHSRAYPIAPAL